MPTTVESRFAPLQYMSVIRFQRKKFFAAAPFFNLVRTSFSDENQITLPCLILPSEISLDKFIFPIMFYLSLKYRNSNPLCLNIIEIKIEKASATNDGTHHSTDGL